MTVVGVGGGGLGGISMLIVGGVGEEMAACCESFQKNGAGSGKVLSRRRSCEDR